MIRHFKYILVVAVILLSVLQSNAQNVKIDEEGTAPASSAMLEVDDTLSWFFGGTRYLGFLMPRMTEAQKNAIVQPATGLIIYQIDSDSGFHYNQGPLGAPDWVRITDSSQLTDPTIEEVLIEGNNANGQAMYGIDSLGVDNPSAPSSKLHINESGGSTSILLFSDQASGSTTSDGFRIGLISGNSELRNQEDGPITFSTNLLERMRLTNDGLAIDTINTSFSLLANGSARVDRLGINSVFTFPGSDGANGEILTTDGTGTLTWATNTTGDNMGNHIAIRNIFTDSNYVSNDGGNEGLYIDTAGNAGIGLDELFKKFTVYDPTFPMVRVTASAAGTNNIINASVLQFAENNTSDFDVDGYGFKLRYVGNGSSTDRFQFLSKNNGTEDLVLLLKRTNRRVGIGVEQPDTWLHVVHIDDTLDGISISNTADNDRWHFHTTDTNGMHLYINDSIRGAFSSTSGAYFSLSDQRAKKNVTEVVDVLEKLSEVRIVEYRYKDQDKEDPSSIGVLAQDLERHFPSLVVSPKENKSSLKTVNYGALNAIAVAGATEQYNQLEELEKRLSKLENKLKSQE